MGKLSQFVLGAAVLLGATAAQAQTTPPPQLWNTSNWKYSGRSTIPVKMYQYVDSRCRPALARAVSTYSAQRSRLVFSHSSSTTTTYNLENGNNSDLIVSYFQTSAMDTPTALAETDYTKASGSSNVFGPGFLVSDTDIRINFDYMMYGGDGGSSSVGRYYCPSTATTIPPLPSNWVDSKLIYDFETIMLHELTHAAGLSHWSDTNCAMRDGYQAHVQRRFYCTSEANFLKSLYGTL